MMIAVMEQGMRDFCEELADQVRWYIKKAVTDHGGLNEDDIELLRLRVCAAVEAAQGYESACIALEAMSGDKVERADWYTTTEEESK